MKTLAAVSIRQYDKAVTSLRQYDHTVLLGLQIVMRGHREQNNQPRPAPGRRLGAIVFGSELGMCGQFNEVVVSHALERCRELPVTGKDLAIMAVGARAVSRLDEAKLQVEASFAMPGAVSGITSRVQELLLKIEAWQGPGGVDRVMLSISNRSRVGFTGLKSCPCSPWTWTGWTAWDTSPGLPGSCPPSAWPVRGWFMPCWASTFLSPCTGRWPSPWPLKMLLASPPCKPRKKTSKTA